MQLRDGVKTVTTAGTAERVVAASTPFVWAKFWANDGNTGDHIVIGGTTVVAAEANRCGGQLDKHSGPPNNVQSAPLRIDGPSDLTDIWIDAEVNGDKCHFIYMEP